jgi:hypothetical protein
MLPVAVALIGKGQDRATITFIDWFGPRGLASVVFALLAIVAHGITARPLASRYVATRPAPKRSPSGG